MGKETQPNEQVLESQAISLLALARKKRYQETSWDKSTLKQALALFYPILNETRPLVVFAEIGPCPFREDCGEECGLPNTLALRPILGDVDIEGEKKFYQKESEWLDREDSSLRRISCVPVPLPIMDAVGKAYWEEQMKEPSGRIKIYPL